MKFRRQPGDKKLSIWKGLLIAFGAMILVRLFAGIAWSDQECEDETKADRRAAFSQCKEDYPAGERSKCYGEAMDEYKAMIKVCRDLDAEMDDPDYCNSVIYDCD